MGRLIDTDDLVQYLSYEDTEEMIDNIPTTYDLDEVLEQLEDNAVEFELFGICSDYVPLGQAIEIIKCGRK